MTVYFLVGRFPELSESFIVRKLYGLANAGHDITALTRRGGNFAVLNSFGLMPEKLRVQKIFNENGPYTIIDFLNMVYVGSLLIFRFKKLKLLCKVLRNEKKFTIRNLLKYGSLLVLRQPDILHFEFSNLAISYHLIVKLWSCKFVFSTRGSDVHLLPFKSEAYKNLFTQVAESFDKIHAVSQKIKENASLKMLSDKVFVNRPAAPETRMSKTLRHNDTPIIVSTGRLEWIKGYDYLLAAFAILKSRNVKFKALIIGDGTLKNELLFSIDDLGLTDCVELTGKLFNQDVLNILRTSDIFVLSSHEEGISNAVLEAMSLGIPVVSTDCGGMAEVIINNENGLLVPIRQPYALSEAIKHLIENTAERTRVGMAGKETIKSDFTIDRQIKVFEEEYYKMLTI